MDTTSLQFDSPSVATTIQLGYALGQQLQRGDIVLLSGDLGAGKTHFSKGIVAGIGSADTVTSPTFVFINEYRGPQRLPIFHVDLYRINTPAELDSIGLDDATAGSGICLIEWPERDQSLYHIPHLAVTLTHVDPQTRRITYHGHGERAHTIITALAQLAPIRHLQKAHP